MVFTPGRPHSPLYLSSYTRGWSFRLSVPVADSLFPLPCLFLVSFYHISVNKAFIYFLESFCHFFPYWTSFLVGSFLYSPCLIHFGCTTFISHFHTHKKSFTFSVLCFVVGFTSFLFLNLHYFLLYLHYFTLKLALFSSYPATATTTITLHQRPAPDSSCSSLVAILLLWSSTSCQFCVWHDLTKTTSYSWQAPKFLQPLSVP